MENNEIHITVTSDDGALSEDDHEAQSVARELEAVIAQHTEAMFPSTDVRIDSEIRSVPDEDSTAIDRDDIIGHVESTYKDHITIYEHDHYLRITDESGSYYAVITIRADSLGVSSFNYGVKTRDTYPRTIDGLEQALYDGLGL